ncbi:MAG: hypothetical protein OIF38_07285 [Cellvibrionaceae bacterium]|nr:hypothetical protein [Cellvibrionaceae bacterium]
MGVRVLLLLLAFGAAQTPAQEPLQENRRLRMAATNIMPWGGYDDSGRATIGLHVELLRQLGLEWGSGYVVKVMPYARIVREVETGHADIGVLFDVPYAHDAGELLVALPPVSAVLIYADEVPLEALHQHPEIKIGRLRLGRYAYKSLPFEARQMVALNSVTQGVEMLKHGRLQVLMTTVPAFRYAKRALGIDSLPGFKMFKLGDIRGAIFLSKNSDLKRSDVQGAALRAMAQHWQELEDMSTLYSDDGAARPWPWPAPVKGAGPSLQ